MVWRGMEEGQLKPKRLDGRQAFDYRTTKVSFGVERGCCQVQLGKTRVLAQVSCEVVEPKLTRPTDGILYVNVELSPMASPGFEVGRLSDQGVEMNRLLERCLKESRCIDMESLCIVARKKVWQIRLDIHVLNHEGNLIDCASIAGIAALAHFRRPDVTVSGEDVTIHPKSEKDPVSLSVHHMPICTSFAFYDHGKFLLVDPTDREEHCMEGKMVIGMNKHREICTLQMTGDMLLLKDQVLRCSNIAVVKVTELTKLIQNALENDAKARAAGEKCGFAISEKTEKITANYRGEDRIAEKMLKEALAEAELEEEMAAGEAELEEEMAAGAEGMEEEDEEGEEKSQVKIIGPGTASIGAGGPSTWVISDDEMEEVQVIQVKKGGKTSVKGNKEVITLDSGSEEEEVVVLTQQDQVETIKSVVKCADVEITGSSKGKKRRNRKR
ncbi:exosome complex component RRP45-like isoform X2 [Lineus longissimus]|uniref:exosome complex component RRP45-like isoform X2 n=1 Tax=Lineus longissimus TaxID=88925 RepID=UPI00315C5B4F